MTILVTLNTGDIAYNTLLRTDFTYKMTTLKSKYKNIYEILYF